MSTRHSVPYSALTPFRDNLDVLKITSTMRCALIPQATVLLAKTDQGSVFKTATGHRMVAFLSPFEIGH
jgi:hypothetical protein